MALKRKEFADLITFTRSSVKNVFGSNGFLQEVAADTPAFEYDPVTGEALGILIEEQRTNSLLHNRDASQSGWFGAGIVTAADGIDGITGSAFNIANAGGEFDRRERTIAVSDDTATHYGYCFVKKNMSPNANFRMSLSGGSAVTIDVPINTTTGDTGSATFPGGEIVDAGDWYVLRTAISNNGTGNTTLTVALYPRFGNAGAASQDFDFVQVELNSTFATSPIVTAGSAVTRSGDNARSTVGGELNNDEFSFALEVVVPDHETSTFQRLISYHDNDGAENNTIDVFRTSGAGSGSARFVFFKDGAIVFAFSYTGAALTDGERAKVACRIKPGDFGISVNGDPVEKNAASETLFTILERQIGSSENNTTTRSWGGSIKNITEYPRALSDAQLIEASTL